jgi:hypothetical protein
MVSGRVEGFYVVKNQGIWMDVEGVVSYFTFPQFSPD